MVYLIQVVSLVAALWTFFDSQQRGYSFGRGLLWAVGVFLLVIVFLPLYLRSRRNMEMARAEADQSLKSCFYCRQPYQGRPSACPHCGQKLNP